MLVKAAYVTSVSEVQNQQLIKKINGTAFAMLVIDALTNTFFISYVEKIAILQRHTKTHEL